MSRGTEPHELVKKLGLVGHLVSSAAAMHSGPHTAAGYQPKLSSCCRKDESTGCCNYANAAQSVEWATELSSAEVIPPLHHCTTQPAALVDMLPQLQRTDPTVDFKNGSRPVGWVDSIAPSASGGGRLAGRPWKGGCSRGCCGMAAARGPPCSVEMSSISRPPWPKPCHRLYASCALRAWCSVANVTKPTGLHGTDDHAIMQDRVDCTLLCQSC